MIISTRNWLPDLDLVADVDVPFTADGYEIPNLWQGGTAKAWRSASSITQFHLFFRLTTGRPLDFAAVFDVRASDGATVEVRLLRQATYGFAQPSVDVGEIEINARGDGSLKLPVPIATAGWVLQFNLSASALLYIGGLWLGQASSVSKAPTRLARSKQGNSILNVTEAKTSASARLASPTNAIDLEWSALTQEQSDEIADVFDALQGSGSACVIVPDEDVPSDAYYGRIGDSQQFSTEPSGYWFGHSLRFDEDGRSIGG